MTVERLSIEGQPYEWDTEKVLGSGSYGSVFLGVAPDGGEVAVKVVPIRTNSTERWYSDARLAERELDVLGRINDNHPNLLPILASSPTENGLVLVMPRAERSLAEDIAAGPLSEAAVREVVLQGARGLQQLARLAVVHRDIAPGNVFRWRDRWVLGDFGVARILEERTSTYTWSMTGTRAYWAPELFRSDPATPQSDLYALACVALEALNGTLPFANDESLGRAHALHDPPLPDLQDVALRRVLTEMLVKDPAGRPPDARRVVELLSREVSRGQGREGLARLSSAASSRRLRVSRLDAERREIEERRKTALEILDRLWDEVVEEASAEDETKSSSTKDTKLLDYADSRLKLQVVTPPFDGDLLLCGLVTVIVSPNAEPTYPVNLLCTWIDGRLRWEIASFFPNATFVQRQKGGGPSRHADGGALDLARLIEVWPSLKASVPPLFTRKFDLTSDALMQEFVAEVEAGPGWI